MSHQNGYFIAIEGMDGSGKTNVVIPALAEFLKTRLIDPLLTREPGGTPCGELIRELTKHPVCKDVDHTVLALLMSASRRDHVVRTIIPALAKGSVVVSDRYIASTVMYQHDAKDLSRIVEIGCAGLLPDLVIMLDIPYEVYCQRLAERSDAATQVQDHLDVMDATLFNKRRAATVSYTHLTLPTKRIV